MQPTFRRNACHLLTCWFLLKFSSTLKMEAICSSETSVADYTASHPRRSYSSKDLQSPRSSYRLSFSNPCRLFPNFLLNYLIQSCPVGLFRLSFNSNCPPSIPVLSKLFTRRSHCSSIFSNFINKFWIPISSLKISFLFISLPIFSYAILKSCMSIV
jgi:hypothetical protein